MVADANKIEKGKRSAAGMANATAGRSRTFRDRTKYNRKGKKNEKVHAVWG